MRLCRAGATAVVCYDWNDAPAVQQLLIAAGIAVPGRVSVACCSDLHWFTRLTPTLTAVAIPMRTLALEATDHLLELIEGRGGSDPATLTQPTALRIRDSTATARNSPRKLRRG